MQKTSLYVSTPARNHATTQAQMHARTPARNMQVPKISGWFPDAAVHVPRSWNAGDPPLMRRFHVVAAHLPCRLFDGAVTAQVTSRSCASFPDAVA
jgi:hypothetical protein